jgi:hypothetical protein
MDSLWADIKEKKTMVTFTVCGFILLALGSEWLYPPLPPTPAIKGNKSYMANFIEAAWMKDKGQDPYVESLYFSQNYLLFQGMCVLLKYPILNTVFRLFFCISLAALLAQLLGSSKTVKTILTALLLLNPVTIYFYREQTLTFFEYTLMLAPIFFLRTRHNFLTSSVLFGLMIYLNPRGLLFLSILTQSMSDKGRLNRRTFWVYIVLAVSIALVLGAATDILSGHEGV